MPAGPYYVYALKDPRTTPAKPFYIGKGTGSRAHAHILKPDHTRKGARILEIESSGHKVLVTPLVTGLSELEAMRVEAELIAALGTERTGGLLKNAVVPSGRLTKRRGKSVVPQGCIERAQLGLKLLKDAVMEFTQANPAGVKNAQVATELGLQSESGGQQKDYLSYSILGLLMREGRVYKAEGRYRARLEARIGSS